MPLPVLRTLGLIFFSTLLGCGGLNMAAANAGAPTGAGFAVREVTLDGKPHRYGIFIPYSYAKEKAMPTIVFLHGLLQAGSSGTGAMGEGLGPNIARHPADFPAIAVFPQSSGDWTGADRDRLAMAVLDDVEANYAVDKDRVVLTGLSNGGYGAWHIGAAHVDRFAAIVPVSGQGDAASVARLLTLPVWCFHNSGDFIIGVGHTRAMVEKLKAAGAKFLTYTEFKAFGHECWNQVYGDPKVIEWMVSQRRSIHKS